MISEVRVKIRRHQTLALLRPGGLILTLYGLTTMLGAGWQSGDDAKPTFEAASIKRNVSERNGSGGKKMSPGRLTIDRMAFRDILEECYNFKGYQLTGAPRWLESEEYDIIAAAGGNTPSAQLDAMLQTLLEDRLKLKFHWAVADVSGFALVVGKNGAKFHEYQATSGEDSRSLRERVEVGKFSSRKTTMKRLASYLSITLQAPVSDQTNLGGMYEIAFEFSRDVKAQADSDSGPPAAATAVEEQLGLKLVKGKVPVQMFVIDHIEKPSEN